MTINEILNAKDAIAKLNTIKFNDFKIVSRVYKLTKQVNTVIELYQQEVQKTLKMYAKLDEQGVPVIVNNQYQFEDVQHRDDFIKEIENVKSSEAEDVDRIDIKIDSIQFGSDLTSAEMLMLDPVVNWIE